MRLRGKLFGFLIIVAAFSPAVMAQQNLSAPTQFALEVHFYPNQPPAYQTVPLASPRGAWFARFGHAAGWKQPPDSLPVTAVDIKSELAEEGVRVWVSALLGEYHQQVTKIASYVLHEGEKVTVQELAQVGVEPFVIKLVRLNPSLADMPQFASKAKSIEVVVMQPNISTLPTYQVVVRNVSSKNVVAMGVSVLQGGRRRISSMPRGKEDEPIIAPGGTYEFTAKLATQATPTAEGYTPAVLANQVIEISSAIFDDGSFEGDLETALMYAAFHKGEKLQLVRVLELLERSLASNDTEASTTLASLKSEVAALKFEADADSVQEVRAKFANLTARQDHDLKPGIEVSMKGLRDAVVKEITLFQLRNRRLDSNTLRDWLATSKQRYEARLRRP